MRDLGQLTAWLDKMETTVEQNRPKSAALSRAAAATVQNFQDNLGKQHAEFEVKIGVMHSDLENIAKVVGDAQDAFDKARVRHEDLFGHDDAGVDPKSTRFSPGEHGGDRKVMAKVVELKIARGDALPIKSMVPDVRREGGGLEKLAGASRGAHGQPSRVPIGLLQDVSRMQQEITDTWRAPKVAQFGDLVVDHIRVCRALKKLTTGEASKVVGAVRDADGFQVLRRRFEPTVTGNRASSWPSSAG